MTTLLGCDREAGSPLPLHEQFRFDAGTPPLNLLATLGFRGSSEPVERLTSPARLGQWLAANGLPAVAVNDAAMATAVGLREAAYSVLAAVVAGTTPPPDAVAVVGDWAARPLPGTGLRVTDTKISWDEPEQSIETVLGAVARELATLAVEGSAELRSCDAESCRMLYLDRSRGRRRRWCSMGRCGNGAKVARHRARVTADPEHAAAQPLSPAQR